jgi:hypothetical protein
MEEQSTVSKFFGCIPLRAPTFSHNKKGVLCSKHMAVRSANIMNALLMNAQMKDTNQAVDGISLRLFCA